MTNAITGIAATLIGGSTEGRAGSVFAAIKAKLPIALWLTLARERRQLGRLSDRQLHDIGIDPVEARREAARPFWDSPRRG